MDLENRNTLQNIRESASRIALSTENRRWQMAYEQLAYSADVMDAIITQSAETRSTET